MDWILIECRLCGGEGLISHRAICPMCEGSGWEDAEAVIADLS